MFMKKEIESVYDNFRYNSGLSERFKNICKTPSEHNDQDDLKDE